MTSTVADYVVLRLKQYGVDTLFGIPGTSCAAVFASCMAQGLQIVMNSSELDAGYAADGYARMKGLAAVSVSYGVGTLSLVNAIAGSLVERAAVVVVNGGPSAKDLWNERRYGVLFSHSTGRAGTDLEVFAKVTSFAARVDRVSEVPGVVDRAIATALRECRPVYLEVANDIWQLPCEPPIGSLDVTRAPSGSEDLVANEICALIGRAHRPALLLGVEVARYGLAEKAKDLIRRSGIPWATTLLAKTVLPENLPGFVGVYDSDLAPKPVREVIEGSDCLVAVGAVLGVDHSKLATSSFAALTSIADGWVRIGDSVPRRAELAPLLDRLASCSAAPKRAWEAAVTARTYDQRRPWAASKTTGAELTHDEFYRTIDRHLDEEWVVVHDTCLGSYPAADLNVKGQNAFVCCPVWLSIGHSIGAAIGVGVADKRRPLVVCGDGGFQTAAVGLSAMARYKIPAVVLVIDNGLYAIEQYLIDPSYFAHPGRDPLPYVALNRWDYPGLAKAMGFAHALSVGSTSDLAQALHACRSWRSPGLISVRVKQRDLPPENQVAGAMELSAFRTTG